MDEIREDLRRREAWKELVVHLERLGSIHGSEVQGEMVSVLEMMMHSGREDWTAFAEPRLEKLYLHMGESGDLEAWKSLASLYLDRSERLSTDVEGFLKARRASSRIFEERLGETENALVVLISSLGSDVVGQPQILDDLERLGQKTGSWSEIVSAVMSAGQEAQGVDRVNVLKRLAKWAVRFAGDEVRGADLLWQVLELAPEDREALGELDALYRKRNQFGKLAELLILKAEIESNPSKKVEIWFELARLAQGPLDDSSTAAEAFEQVLLIEPTHGAASMALEAIYEDKESWADLLEVLKRRALGVGPGERVRLESKIGRVLARLGEIDAAVSRLKAAHPDPRELVQALRAEAQSAEPGPRARFLAEIGHVYAKSLKEPLAAFHFYEQAISSDSQVLDAAEPLADAYLADEAWEKALGLLETLVRRYRTERDAIWLHKRWLQIALASEKLGRKAQSAQAYREAFEINPRDFRTLKGLSRLQFELGDHGAALRGFQRLLEDFDTSLAPNERLGVLYMSGLAFKSIGQIDRAVEFFERVLALNPGHLNAIRHLVEHYESKQDWGRWVPLAEARIRAEPEPLVRFRQYCRLGEVCHEKLNRPDLAMQAYRGAIDIDPESIVVLRKLLDLYTKTQKYPLAVKVLERLIERESDSGRQAKLHYTAAVLYRDHIGDRGAALRHFDVALDSDAGFLKAFEAIDRILTESKDWRALEIAYRRMLKRLADVGQAGSVERMLLRGLGEIYRTRLGDLKSALGVFEVLRSRYPEEEGTALILADLYGKTGDVAGGQEIHRELLLQDPLRVESYSALFDLYMANELFDEAWSMAAILSFLRVSMPAEEQFYQEYLGKNLKLAKGRLNHEAMGRVVHPDQDPLISAILSYASQALRPMYSENLKGVVDPKKDLIPQGKGVFRKLYDYAGQTLGLVSLPEVYRIRERGLVVLNAERPALGVGTDRLESENDRENAFLVARMLYATRPETYLGALGFDASVIYTMFLATLESVDPSFGFSAQSRDPNFAKAVKEMRKIPDQMSLSLRTLVAEYKRRGGQVDIVRWLRGMEHTANRIGLLLCGDLALSASLIKYGTTHFSDANSEECLRELTKFAASPLYVELRHELGLGLASRSY